MPLKRPVLPMSIDEFHRMEHRLGWKHEYWDGAARLSTQETAVASFQRPVDQPVAVSASLRDDQRLRLVQDDQRLRLIQDDDEQDLAELFCVAFDQTVEFAGYPDDAYQRDACESVAEFVGKPVRRRGAAFGAARRSASYVISAGGRPVAAILIRSASVGPILQPLMVHPNWQRRGLGAALLAASLKSLHAEGATTLFSRCHLGNPVSLAWHEKHGFVEIPTYFSASHRWRHFGWMVKHYEGINKPKKAAEAAAQRDRWRAVVEEFETSGELGSGIF